MRRITLWLLSTLTTLVMLFSYHTSTTSAATTSIQAQASVTAGNATSGNATSGNATSGTTPSTSTTDTTTDTTTASGTVTYTGDAVGTRYGNVQVQLTVTDGRVTKAEITQVPWSNGRDQQINSYAVPILNSEAVNAQSTNIDMVSGATYTSRGYIESLQSALDQAHL